MIYVIIIITLLVFLVTRELAGTSDSEPAQRVGNFLIFPIISLLVLFVLIVALTVTKILS